MRTVRIKIYKFSELSETAKEVAINSLRDINVDYEWWEGIYEDAAKTGLDINTFELDRGAYCNGVFNLSPCEVAQNIINGHGEMCDTYKTAAAFLEQWQPVFNSYMDENSEDYESGNSEDKMQEMEEDFLKSLCEDYRIILQNEFEYLCSDKAIIEIIEANEYEFTKEGKMYK